MNDHGSWIMNVVRERGLIIMSKTSRGGEFRRRIGYLDKVCRYSDKLACGPRGEPHEQLGT